PSRLVRPATRRTIATLRRPDATWGSAGGDDYPPAGTCKPDVPPAGWSRTASRPRRSARRAARPLCRGDADPDNRATPPVSLLHDDPTERESDNLLKPGIVIHYTAHRNPIATLVGAVSPRNRRRFGVPDRRWVCSAQIVA